MASVTVFRTQMKIFERKFLSDRSHDSRVFNADELVKKAEDAFKKKQLEDPDHMSLSLTAASNMKKKIE